MENFSFNELRIEKIENVKWGSFLPLCLLYSIIFFPTSYFSSALLVIPLIIFILSGVEGHCCQEIFNISPLTLTFSCWVEIALSPRDGVSQRMGNECDIGHFRTITVKI